MSDQVLAFVVERRLTHLCIHSADIPSAWCSALKIQRWKAARIQQCRNTRRQLITSSTAQGMRKVLRSTGEEVAVLLGGGEVRLYGKVRDLNGRAYRNLLSGEIQQRPFFATMCESTEHFWRTWCMGWDSSCIVEGRGVGVGETRWHSLECHAK